MSKRPASSNALSDDQRLDAFMALGDSILARRAVREGLGSGFSVEASNGGPARFIATGPDAEDYRSLMLDLRKLIAPGSGLQFERVIRAAQSAFPDDPDSWFPSLRRAWTQALRVGTIRFVHDGQVYTPERLITLWFNGELFHDDPDKREEWDRLGATPFPIHRVVIEGAVVKLVQLLMAAMARIDYLRGGPGKVRVAAGRAKSPGA